MVTGHCHTDVASIVHSLRQETMHFSHMTLITWIQFIYGQAHVKPVLQYQLSLTIYPFSVLFATLVTKFLVKITFSFYSIYIPAQGSVA